jgi:hypothetical protein
MNVRKRVIQEKALRALRRAYATLDEVSAITSSIFEFPKEVCMCSGLYVVQF